ncbi:MAG: hypothetical protein K6E20_03650 [Acholeplasmatales bacterium]|nr:hypothetical protein [Acholeplasmatales bacterium]
MPSSIVEEEKRYNSIYVDKDSAKRDIKLISNSYVFKTKKDFITPILIIIGIFLFVLGILLHKKIAVMIIFIILSILFIAAGVVYFLLNKKKKQKSFISYYENSIESLYKVKYEEELGLSSLFPIRAKWDNELKIIEFIYNEQHIKVVYDDILNYTILEDDKDLEVDRINNINYNSKSYTLQITFNNKTRGYIKFDNNINYFKIDNSFNHLIDSNVKSMHNIGAVLDKIIHKNII